jgi:hypothetical protein
LQQLKDGADKKAVTVFQPENVRYNERWGEKQYEWTKASIPALPIFYFVPNETSCTIEISDEKNNIIYRDVVAAQSGFHYYRWNLKGTKPADPKVKGKQAPEKPTYVTKGKYKIKFTANGTSAEVTAEVK